MAGIRIVVNGVSVSLDAATLEELQAVLKQAIDGQLSIQKQQEDAALAMETGRFSFVDKIYDWLMQAVTTAHAGRMSVLEKKLEIAKVKAGHYSYR